MKRKWARRMIRAGWLLSPILNFFFGSRFNFFRAILIIAACTGVTYCTRFKLHLDDYPTPAEVKVYMTGNTPAVNECMARLVPIRRDQYKTALSNARFQLAVEACVEATENWERERLQDAAIKAAK